MFRDTLLSTAAAGLLAALTLTLLQIVWITPLILQAETYETDEPSTAPTTVAAHDHGDGPAHEHHHDDSEWKPRDGWQRTGFTLAANILMGLGYGFILMAVYLLWREPQSTLAGSVYGLAGFAVFFAAPGLGLPAELPGTAAAALTDRQLWWVFTVVMSGCGALLLFSRRALWIKALGLLLIVTPHLIPAPQPAVAASLAPQELQRRFQLATAVSNAAFWLVLGAASGLAFRKMLSTHGRGAA